MKIQESAENYLETIRRFSAQRECALGGNCRSPGFQQGQRQCGDETAAGKWICRGGRRGYITLTSPGMEIAQRIYERHQVLTNCLVALGVSEEVAAEDACRVEHFLSAEKL